MSTNDLPINTEIPAMDPMDPRLDPFRPDPSVVQEYVSAPRPVASRISTSSWSCGATVRTCS